MNPDLRCLSVGLVLFVILGMSWAVPVDLFESEGWQQDNMQEEVKRFPTDSSITSFIPASGGWTFCTSAQSCRDSGKGFFNCRCNPTVAPHCVSSSIFADATCEASQVGGTTYTQPAIGGR